MRHAETCGCGTCPRVVQGPIWPSNSANETIHQQQMLFNRDDHNHSEVLGERTVTLPLMVPTNRAPFVFTNQTSGTRQRAPYSTDNVMHTEWAPYRALVNVNTPIGSDSAILFQSTIPRVSGPDAFYEGTPANQGYDKWKDWLDNQAGMSDGTASDARVSQACAPSGADQVCAQTCVDWWTMRPVPPQGSLQRPELPSSGGCPFNTLQAMTCYPCQAQTTYVPAASTR